MNYIRQETGPTYLLSEFIQLMSLLAMWGLTGKKYLNEIVVDSKLEDWLKCGVSMKRQHCRESRRVEA